MGKGGLELCYERREKGRGEAQTKRKGKGDKLLREEGHLSICRGRLPGGMWKGDVMTEERDVRYSREDRRREEQELLWTL